MHELGILMEIVKTVEKFAVENQVDKIETLVLQIGEISSAIPEYMKRYILRQLKIPCWRMRSLK